MRAKLSLDMDHSSRHIHPGLDNFDQKKRRTKNNSPDITLMPNTTRAKGQKKFGSNQLQKRVSPATLRTGVYDVMKELERMRSKSRTQKV